MKTKRCSTCKETKPVSEFYKNRRAKDGLASNCKMCGDESTRRYRKNNREKVSERKRRYYEANKEKIAERVRRYQEANKEKMAEKSRRYYEANRSQFSRSSVKSMRKSNNRSLEFAHRKGQPWKDWEDEFVLADNGLTNYQKSVKLGRTYYATRERRKNLKERARNELTHDNVRV